MRHSLLLILLTFTTICLGVPEARAFSDSTNWTKGYDSAFRLRNSNTDSSISLTLSLLVDARSAHFKYGEIKALNLLGLLHRRIDEYDRAIAYHDSVLQLTKSSFPHERSRALMYQGIALKNEESYSEALAKYLEALEGFKEINALNDLGKCLNNIGVVYSLQHQFGEAVEHFKMDLEVQTELENIAGMTRAQRNIGSAYSQQKKFKDALNHLTIALELQSQLEDPYREAHLLNSVASVYIELKATEQAKPLLEKAHNIMLQLQDEPGLMITYNNLGRLSELKKDFQLAITQYESAASLALKYNLAQDLMIIHKNLSRLYENVDQHQKALYHLELSHSWNDSLIQRTNKHRLLELEERYEAKNREEQIKLLEEKEQLQSDLIVSQQKENEQQTTVLYVSIGSGILVAIVLSLIGYNLHLRRKSAQLEAEQTEAEKHRQIERLMQEQEVQNMSAMLEGQEQERARIASDLHDRLGSMLSTVKLHFELVGSKLPENNTSEPFEKANELLDEAVHEVRKISHNMVSGVLAKFGLMAALDDLKNNLNQTGKLHVDLISLGLDDRLDSTTEITIYRIIQELIGNILKHAEASEIIIQMQRHESTINIMVEDDGKGFDKKLVDMSSGMGLSNVQARVKQLKGELSIDTQIGHGTTVIIDIPNNLT